MVSEQFGRFAARQPLRRTRRPNWALVLTDPSFDVSKGRLQGRPFWCLPLMSAARALEQTAFN